MKAARQLPVLSDEDKARFFSHVLKNPENDGCWIWTGNKGGNGYGYFGVNGQSYLAHRLSFVLAGGTFENGYLVCHGPCNNPLCVNPNHLSAGTHKSNVMDMFRDGTISRGESHRAILLRVAARGDRNSSRKNPERLPRGVEHHAAKLTPEIVEEIRTRYRTMRVPQRVIAEHFGINQSVVSRVVHQKSWKHVV